jgi:GNAT superfamily N-acetyltransferase
MRKPDLAAQLQRAEGALLELNLRPDPSAPAGGVRICRIDGVICLAVPGAPTPYINRALGFGTLATATPRLLERLIAHYDALGRETRISIATGHTPEAAIRLLADAGFVPDPDMDQLIYLRAGRRPPEPPQVPGLRLVRVHTAADAERFADTAQASFGPERGPGYRASVRQLLERARSGRSMIAVLGLIGDLPVATGMLHFLGPVCGLGTGSVLPEHRGQGIQRALLAERIRIGFGRTANRYFAFTENPASARNLEELGFRKVYDQVSWVRPRTSGSSGMG